MSYLRPLLSVTWVKRNAFLSFSGMPPRNCQRRSRCISMSLLIGRVTRMRRPAASSALRCACRSAYISVHGDVHLAYQRPPLRLLRSHELGERFRRAADHLAALALQALAHRRVGEHLAERAVQALEDRLGRLGWREDSGPGGGFKSGIGLGDRRHAGPE